LHQLDNRLSDKGAIAIATALHTNTHLTTLIIRITNCGLASALALGEALKINNTLTHLDFQANAIGDDGVAALYEGIKNNTALTFVDITDMSVVQNNAKVFELIDAITAANAKKGGEPKKNE